MPNLKETIDLTGSDAASKVLLDLLNEFPGLSKDDKITFGMLGKDYGISFNPVSGAEYLMNVESIIGHVRQVCSYPFVVIYRSAPRTQEHKIRVREWLELLGRWLERQPITIDDTTYQLDEYPALNSGNRKIRGIDVTNAIYCQTAWPDGIEDWVLMMALRYDNEFYK